MSKGEPEEIALPLTGDRAIVIGPEPESDPSPRWHAIGALTSSELAALLRTLDPAVRAYVESQRLTGRLVELDQTTRTLWKTAKVVTEDGGWIQATLRDRGKIVRLMRIRPATGVAALSGGVAVLGAVAAQAQAAEMARDIKSIRQRVDQIYKHLLANQIAAAENAVEQVQDLVDRLRADGARGIERSELPILKNDLGKQNRACLRHLGDALTELEAAADRSPRRAEKELDSETVQIVTLNLDLLSELYSATAQLGLAQVALDYHDGKPDVARTRALRLAQSMTEFHAGVDDARGRIVTVDEAVRTGFRPAWSSVQKVASAGADLAPKAKLGGRAAAGLGVLAVGAGAVDDVVRDRAQKKLDQRLEQLSASRQRNAEVFCRMEPAIDLLRSLPDELTGTFE